MNRCTVNSIHFVAVSGRTCDRVVDQLLRFGGQIAMSNPGISKIEFAADSPLEGSGFEPSVPARDRNRIAVPWAGVCPTVNGCQFHAAPIE
jgi:hypothetical protein